MILVLVNNVFLLCFKFFQFNNFFYKVLITVQGEIVSIIANGCNPWGVEEIIVLVLSFLI